MSSAANLETLDVNVYTPPRRPEPSKMRATQRTLHDATLKHMRTAGYVMAYRQLESLLPGLSAQLLPPPPENTQTHMEQVHAALASAQEVTTVSGLSGGVDDVKFTAAQRAFMNSFYTLQLRALDAARKCMRWASDECVAHGQRIASELAAGAIKCGAWRSAWNERMRPPSAVASTDAPQDVVAAWTGPRTLVFEQLAAQAVELEASTCNCLDALTRLQQEYERTLSTHMAEVERLKAAEAKKLQAHAVPPELEAVSLKSYAAHVRDLLSSSPELNLFF